MFTMLRSCGRLAKHLESCVAPRSAVRVVASKEVLLRSAHMSLSSATVQPLPARTPKDYALPNSSWSKDMMGQFNKFMEMCKDGRWKRIPSHRCVEEGVPEYMKQKMDVRKKARDTRFFLRSMDKGLGFEYVMFFNPSQKRMTCIVQLGPYVEGPPGFVHGGSIATMFDATCSMCALFADSAFLTATFTINYKCPVQVGAVLLVDVKVERTEGRKVYLSGQVHSADGQTLYADGTALMLQLGSDEPF